MWSLTFSLIIKLHLVRSTASYGIEYYEVNADPNGGNSHFKYISLVQIPRESGSCVESDLTSVDKRPIFTGVWTRQCSLSSKCENEFIYTKKTIRSKLLSASCPCKYMSRESFPYLQMNKR